MCSSKTKIRPPVTRSTDVKVPAETKLAIVAISGFELWFGRRPEVTAELRALVEADLTKV